MRTRWSWIGRLVVATVVGCLVQPAWAIELRSDIEAVNAVFASAAARGDSAALAALYADDARIMPAASETIVGRDAIQKFWRGALSSGIPHISLKTIELYGGRDHCTEVGRYELRAKTGKVLDAGKYIVIWHRERGHWKLLRDMFSTDLPPQGS
jgi:ketosteroid isomerase-like protein